MAKEYNIQGKVILEYVIDSTGQLSLPIIKVGIGGGCDNAVLDAFNKFKYIFWNVNNNNNDDECKAG